ncbi:Integral membrane protein 2C [Halocaridina rubra]|uniref:Membrane protein BRI3 n=1 Tax=Halocaridina rubra TaxID=373956 RepID=A0AAN8X688_HALRR
MDSKPPPYNPMVNSPSPPPMGPPPPYQPPVGTAPVGFVPLPSSSTTYIPAASSTTFVTQQTSYGSIPVVVQPVRATDVIIVGGCPACRVGVLNEEFTLPGLCCAFWFFPIGILCCLAMRERRCSNCGAVFT